MLYLDNLVSTVVHQGLPWEFKGSIPAGVADKTKRTAWIIDPSTRHSVYTAWEGVASNLRVSAPKGSTDGNPPHTLHGLVADYDARVGPEEIAKGLERLRIKPNWTSTSLSGYCHAVWIFDAPILIPNRKWTEPFLRHVMAEMNLEGFLPRFDKEAFLIPDKYYTNSLNWTQVHEETVPSSLVTGWSMQVSQMFNWDNEGTAVPLDEVEKELIKRYGESFWPGDWTEGGQGPTFWVPGSVSAKSAIIRATGMQTFASHAPKSFFPWADLVGSAFVKEYETKLMGRAVEGIYHDGTFYIHQVPSGQWLLQSKDDIQLRLMAERGLCNMRKKGHSSEVDKAILYIQDNNHIDVAVPRPFQAPGRQWINGETVLNTFNGKAHAPAEGTHLWGPDGSFPWISELMEKLFPGEQLDFIRSWLHRFYTGCLNNNLESNMVLFIAGPQNIGKTLFGTGIVSRMVGGFADAQSFLAQGDQFNAELFRKALWCVDDSTSSTNATAHRRYTEMLKKVTANQNLRFNEKFKTAGTTNWQGAVIVTCNADPESIRMIPGLDGSILDKLSLLRTSETSVEFPDKKGLAQKLDAELPGFCAFMRAYQIPKQWVGSARYGVKPCHHSDLVRTAQQSSSSAGFAEILETWRTDHFKAYKDKPFWEGTTFEFYRELNTLMVDAGGAGALGMKPDQVGQKLSGLLSKSYPGVYLIDDGGQSRKFRIDPPEDLRPPKKPPEKKKTPTKKEPSRYDKQQ